MYFLFHVLLHPVNHIFSHFIKKNDCNPLVHIIFYCFAEKGHALFTSSMQIFTSENNTLYKPTVPPKKLLAV
ncbi:hypothetical protein D1164_17445 [Mariniphaga sediminis]|uniref:Uncharacterized protein n=1 Tax=Mariniphaga sediminis TaxID=1628158 RepID=A0A399CXN7_9BACT|nr:hypothetical protein D1164_17445 [Mariniphaga sediminis]